MTSGARATPSACVLVVEDDAHMREYMRRLLAVHYDVHAVPDGVAALDVARVRRPDLVLADVVMPRLDGFELLAAIRAEPQLRTIPFILLSVREDEESRVQGLNAGADDYLVKPLSPRELLARVEGALRLARVRRASEDALRASEARQQFLLELSDALRPLADPVAMQNTTMELVARHLGVVRVTYLEVDAEQDGFIRAARYETTPLPLPDHVRLSEGGTDVHTALLAGHTIAFSDTETDALPAAQRERCRACDIRAWVAVPLVKGGRLVAMLSVNQSSPRDWTRADLKLLEEVAERIWGAVARARAESALRESEQRYRILVESVHDYAIFLLDREGVVTDWTTGAERVTGYCGAEVVGRHFSMFYTSESVAADEPAHELSEAAATGRAEREGWRVRKDRERFWANEITTAVRDAEGRLVGYTTISRDLTERRLAEKAAERVRRAAARDELRQALAAAEEAERSRLARDLHDRLGQHLTGFALGLADARRRIATGESADARLEQLEELAQLMTRDARNLALELRPPELDDVGLESALDTYVRSWGARHGVAIDVAIFGAAAETIPRDVGSALYRIAQEALTNIAKHAGASQVSVILEKPDGEVQLLLEDDGCGFDVNSVNARVCAERRLGLAGMRERAALVGGRLAIESSPGVGTTVQVRIPVRKSGPDVPANDSVSALREPRIAAAPSEAES